MTPVDPADGETPRRKEEENSVTQVGMEVKKGLDGQCYLCRKGAMQCTAMSSPAALTSRRHIHIHTYSPSAMGIRRRRATGTERGQ